MSEVRRKFGKGSSVSLFTLGTMRALGSPTQMYEVLKAAVLAGINHIETAPAYGPAENFLGIALKRLQDEKIEPKGGWVITSKLLPGSSFLTGQEQIKAIFKRLNVSKIENLAIHGLNLQEHLDWALEGEGAKILKWVKDQGLVSQTGFSSHGSLNLIKKTLESNIFTFCSLHLHLLDPQRMPLAKLALKKGMGVMAISPADKGGRLQQPSSTLIEDCLPIPPLELAYRFLLANGISTLTLGASQAQDFNIANKLRSSSWSLNKQEQEAINNLQKQRELRLGENLCNQCQQCLPCPKGVPIPHLLNLHNLAIGHDLEVFTKERYNLIGRAGHWGESIDGSACERCGDCLPRCPQELPIPDLLLRTHQLLRDQPKRRLWS